MPFIIGGLIGVGVAVLIALALLALSRRGDQALAIPVAVDAVREVEGRPLVRATYFIAASDRPHPGWAVLLRPFQPPTRVLGDTGILYRPGPWSARFRNARQIDDLFDSIEGHPCRSVEIEDLWIPLQWLDTEGHPGRGDVFRVPIDLFEQAYRYRDGEIRLESLVEAGAPGAVRHSPEESEAFRSWARKQIDVSRTRFSEISQPLRYVESP